MFSFLDRTGSTYYEPIRDLLGTWVGGMPAEHRAGVVGNLLSGDDDKFESALWELYLYAVATGSGDCVEIHPDLAGTSKHPDFLVHGAISYYLEATAVGRSPAGAAADRRLRDLEAVLDQVRIDGWLFVVALRRWRTVRWRRRLFIPLDLIRAQPAPEDAGDDVAALLEEVRRLPRREREVFACRYWMGLSQHETAAALGMAVGTVGATTAHATKKLRERLDERDERSRSAAPTAR